MNKSRNTHAPYMTFTALNHRTILLLVIGKSSVLNFITVKLALHKP